MSLAQNHNPNGVTHQLSELFDEISNKGNISSKLRGRL